MIADFSQHKQLSIDPANSVEFVFYGIHGEPSLMVRHTGEANRQYTNTVLKSDGMQRRLRGRKTKLDIRLLKTAREQDLKLFPKFVVTAWSGVQDSEGNEVPFSPENVEAFLRAIPSDMFDELRGFAGDPDTYREEDELTSEEIEELAGNLPPGSTGS